MSLTFEEIIFMKSLIVTMSLILLSAARIFGQQPAGSWTGVLAVEGQSLNIVFHVVEKDGSYSAKMDSPDQGVFGIDASEVSFENGMLMIKIAAARIEYLGKPMSDEMEGNFKQGPLNLPLTFKRMAEDSENTRPQTPRPPFPYTIENVVFTNSTAKINLSGTLTVPAGKGKFPAVVLISGSGPQNRDEELMGHKPFHVIADFLSRNGIAVLRYDDRGVAQSQGDFQLATSLDFASDAKSAVEYLKERNDIDPTSIGLIGHSEGGMIAPMVAAESKDVCFIVLLAGTGIRGDELLLLQQELILGAAGVSKEEISSAGVTNKKAFEMVRNSKDDQKLKQDLTVLLRDACKDLTEAELPQGMSKEQYVDMQVQQLTSAWMKYFLSYEPASSLKRVTCPVLALNGAMDLQVPADINLEAIESALKKGGNSKVIIKKYPSMNHLFQVCTTGAPSEYSEIRETISPTVLSDIQSWILSDKE
jgi:fermentation-respiration switch protein FrsA (DUF1100 family)